MKRDDDYFRELMISLEDSPEAVFMDPLHMNMTPEEAKQHNHIQLGCDAQLLTPVGRGTFRMTNAGHDFVSAVRDEGIWKRTKEAVATTGGSATLDIIKQLALGLLKKKIAQHTGVDI